MEITNDMQTALTVLMVLNGTALIRFRDVNPINHNKI